MPPPSPRASRNSGGATEIPAMKRSPAYSYEPPRLLEGAALLFWGGVTGHPLIGLFCAFLVETNMKSMLVFDLLEL